MNNPSATTSSALLHKDPLWRILVVDDNPPDVMLTEEALRNQGLQFDITNYSDGEGACLELREQSTCRFHLIILDLNMPKVGGLEVLAVLRSNPAFARVPVMILTSSLAMQERNESFRLGANRFVRKPSDLYEYLNIVGSTTKELLAIGAVSPQAGNT